VLPEADLKLFLDASVEERAVRRIEERGLDATSPEAEDVREQLRRRDAVDSTREVAPLRAADDAVHVHTDGNEFAETVEIVTAEIARVMLNPPKRSARSRARAPKAAAAAIAAAEPAEAAEPAAAAEAAEAAAPGPGQVPEPPISPAPVAEPAPEPAPAEVRRSAVLERAMELDNDQSMLVRMTALVARIGARLFARVRVEGLEHIPRTGAVILAANHISNADPVVIGAWVTDALRRRRIHWLGKRELFDWPVLGLMAAHGGVHPVDRDGGDIEAFRLAAKILERGYVLLVFPEGTRSPTGTLQEAKDGVALLAIRTGAAIVPIGVSNSDAVWRKGKPLPLPFPRRTIQVRIGRPFTIADVVPAGTSRRAAKNIATTAIMGRIAELLDPRHRGVYADAIRPEPAPEP
jgi:1-acyl-sn-glycerol-3-phosphate acyltransferase